MDASSFRSEWFWKRGKVNIERFRQNDKKETFPRKFALIKMRFLDISSSLKIIFFFNYFLIASALGNFSRRVYKVMQISGQFLDDVTRLSKPLSIAVQKFAWILSQNRANCQETFLWHFP